MSATELLRELAWGDAHVKFARKRVLPDPPLPTRPIDEFKLHPANEKAMAKHAKTFVEGVHLGAIHEYKNSSSGFNVPLRRGNPEFKSGRQQVEHVRLMRHVTSVPMPEPQSSYRSNNMSPLKKGDEFTDHGFAGTSLSRQTAENFTTDGSDDDSNDVFAIHAPAGARAYHLDRHSNSPSQSEQELTYHPGTTFRVLGHTRHAVRPKGGHASQKYHVTHLAVVGQAGIGKPSRELVSTPKGKKWLDDTTASLTSLVTAPKKDEKPLPKGLKKMAK